MIADLEVLSRYDQMSPYKEFHGSLPEPVTVEMVGWHGDHVPTTGEVPAPCIDRLFAAYESKKFESKGGLGPHICEVCLRENGVPDYEGVLGLDLVTRLSQPVVHWHGKTIRLYGHGHHLVRLGHRVFMCPVLILHYVLDHGYRPPSDFLDAVVSGAFVTEEDLIGKH